MGDEASDVTAELTARLDRIANLMAIAAIKDLEQPEKIRVLDAVGYTQGEIATFLSVNPATVRTTLFRQRQPKKPSRRRRARER